MLQNIFLTQNLSTKHLHKVVGAMKPRFFKQGEQIIRFGDQGDEYFVLAEGEVKVFVYEDGVAPDDPEIGQRVKFSKTMGKGHGFGEIALLHNSGRTATIKVESEKVETFVLDAKSFKTIVVGASIERRTVQNEFLNKIPIFGKWG
jgi:CRP-like cAMP-binding protein